MGLWEEGGGEGWRGYGSSIKEWARSNEVSEQLLLKGKASFRQMGATPWFIRPGQRQILSIRHLKTLSIVLPKYKDLRQKGAYIMLGISHGQCFSIRRG